MVGATCAERAQFFRPLRAGKGQRVFVVGVVGDDATVRGESSAQSRQDLSRHFPAMLNCRMYETAEKCALLALVGQNKFAHLVDRVNAVEIAIALRCAPCEQPVTAEKNAVGPGVVLHGFFDEQCQFKSRPLPGHPDDLAVELFVELSQLPLAVSARG